MTTNNEIMFSHADARKCGECDAMLGRPCESPWKDMGYRKMRHNAEYLMGYISGEAKIAKQ